MMLTLPGLRERRLREEMICIWLRRLNEYETTHQQGMIPLWEGDDFPLRRLLSFLDTCAFRSRCARWRQRPEQYGLNRSPRDCESLVPQKRHVSPFTPLDLWSEWLTRPDPL